MAMANHTPLPIPNAEKTSAHPQTSPYTPKNYINKQIKLTNQLKRLQKAEHEKHRFSKLPF